MGAYGFRSAFVSQQSCAYEQKRHDKLQGSWATKATNLADKLDRIDLTDHATPENYRGMLTLCCSLAINYAHLFRDLYLTRDWNFVVILPF